jgi:hypothetical protein
LAIAIAEFVAAAVDTEEFVDPDPAEVAGMEEASDAPPIRSEEPERVGITSEDAKLLKQLRIYLRDPNSHVSIMNVKYLQQRKPNLQITSLEAAGISFDELEILRCWGFDVEVGNVSQITDFRMPEGRGIVCTGSVLANKGSKQLAAQALRNWGCLLIDSDAKLDAKGEAFCRQNHVPVIYRCRIPLQWTPKAVIRRSEIGDLQTFTPPYHAVVVVPYDAFDFADVALLRERCSVLLVPPDRTAIGPKQISELLPGEELFAEHNNASLEGFVIVKDGRFQPKTHALLVRNARRRRASLLLKPTLSRMDCNLANFAEIHEEYRHDQFEPPKLISIPCEFTKGWRGQILQMTDIVPRGGNIDQGVFEADAIRFALTLGIIVEWRASPPVEDGEIISTDKIRELLSRQPPISDDDLRSEVAGKTTEVSRIERPITTIPNLKKLHELGANIRFKNGRVTFLLPNVSAS